MSLIQRLLDFEEVHFLPFHDSSREAQLYMHVHILK